MKSFLIICAYSFSHLLTLPASTDPKELTKATRFAEYWISSTIESNLVEKDDPHVDWYAKRFYHQSFYYWLASHGPYSWIDPSEDIERLVLMISKVEHIRSRIAPNFDPAQLDDIDESELGEVLQSGLRNTGESWMPGITLKELGGTEKYGELVRQFRSEILGFAAK